MALKLIAPIVAGELTSRGSNLVELVPVCKPVILEVHFDLVIHLVIDILAASTSNQANNAECHGNHGDDTVVRVSDRAHSRFQRWTYKIAWQ